MSSEPGEKYNDIISIVSMYTISGSNKKMPISKIRAEHLMNYRKLFLYF